MHTITVFELKFVMELNLCTKLKPDGVTFDMLNLDYFT